MKLAIITVLENNGVVPDNNTLKRLMVEEPGLGLVVKWSEKPRECHPACDMIRVFGRNQIENPNDYVREVFIPCNAFDALCIKYGVKNNTL